MYFDTVTLQRASNTEASTHTLVLSHPLSRTFTPSAPCCWRFSSVLLSLLLLCAPAFYPSQYSRTEPSNSFVYLPSCCPVGCSVDSCTCSTKAHRLSQPRSPQHPVYYRVPASCSSPLHRLLSLDRSASVLSDASQPWGASKWRGDRWKEQHQNESLRTRESSNIICCPCVCFLFRAEYQQQDGGGETSASLDYICFIHVVDSHVILVHLHWSMANCCLGKGQAGLQSYYPHPPLHPQTFVLFYGC